MLFSVIIPAYNAEKTIVSTLDTITKQNFFDVEVIVVNDGSTDSTKTIIETYIAEHKKLNIKLFNQENSGVSCARIAGIDQASGDYIGFLDADDGLASNYFEYLSTLIHKYNFPDCINFQYHYIKDVNHKIFVDDKPKKDELIEDKNKIAQTFFARSTNNSLWNKLYKNQIIKHADLSPTKGVTLGEDRLCNILIFKYLKNVVISTVDLYSYFANFYNYKHSKREEKFNDQNSNYLLNYVITNLSDQSVIDDIRIHEIDKTIMYLKIIVNFDKISFKNFKKYVFSLKTTNFYKNFLIVGYPKKKRIERRNKVIFCLLKKFPLFNTFLIIKIL